MTQIANPPHRPAPPPAADFTITPQPDGRWLIAWLDTGATDYRIYAAHPGQGYALIGTCAPPHTSLLYDAPANVPLYLRVYGDSPAGPSGTKTVGPLTRQAPPAAPQVPAPAPAPAPLPAPAAHSAALPIIAAGVQAPATVHVDLTTLMASAETAADLPLLQTDFGDPSSAYNILPGFNAAHLYTQPGTYTISARLTVQAPSTLAWIATTASATVTIAPDARRYIYASAAGVDTNPGTLAAPVKTFARAMSLAIIRLPLKPATIANAGVLFRRGDMFDLTNGINVMMTDARFADFGDPALPRPCLRYTGPRPTAGAVFIPMPGSRNTIIQNLAFDSIYSADTDPVGNLTVVQPDGSNLSVINCLFLNISTAVNCQSQPTGVLVQDCTTPQIKADGSLLPKDPPDATTPGITGVRGYTVYAEGSHLVLLGNTVADSTREHCFRIGGCSRFLIFGNDLQNLDRTTAASSALDPSNISKGCLPIQIGDHGWICQNTFRRGPVGVGPLNRLDLLHDVTFPTLKAQRFSWAVIENNIFLNSQFILQPGAQHVIVRNNISQSNSGDAFRVNGYTAAYDRDVIDAHLLHNTAINTGATGNFLVIAAPNVNDPPPAGRRLATGLVTANNLYSAPRLISGKNGAAPIYVQEADLASFAIITGNLWPPTTNTVPQVHNGVNYLHPGVLYQPAGFVDAAAWAKLGAAGDQFNNLPAAPDGTVANAPSVPNIKGSFARPDGTPRGAMTTVGAK